MPPERVHLPDILRLGKPPPEARRLFAGAVVDDVRGEPVRALARGVAAEHIRMARLAFAVNADLARVVILPDALAVFIAGDEPPAAYGRRGFLAGRMTRALSKTPEPLWRNASSGFAGYSWRNMSRLPPQLFAMHQRRQRSCSHEREYRSRVSRSSAVHSMPGSTGIA